MKKRSKLILIVILLLIIQFPVFYKFWLERMSSFLVYQDKLEQADCILALGGGRGERILQGIALYKQKYAPKMMITGEFYQILYGPVFHWAAQGQKLAVSRGVPEDNVIVVMNSMSTHDDATLSLAECRKRNFHSLIVVSEPFHTRRAYYTFKKVYKGSGIKVIIYPDQDSWYKINDWWYSEEGLMATTDEYIKLTYYRLKGYI
jgi:uncharacterized SAM-binding protein YcdF (DUF218 family)